MAPTAVMVLILRDGAVLGVSRIDRPGAFGLPGGKIEPGEAVRDAAVRELREETGLVVNPNDLAFLYLAPEGSHVVATYLAPDPGGAPVAPEGEGVLGWIGWPALLAGPFGAYNGAVRRALVDRDPAAWIDAYGSGTLRRAREEGLKWRELYLHERVALEYGYGFDAYPTSRVTTGDALAEGDSPATTETCWWARAIRYRAQRDGVSITVRVVHATASDGDGSTRSGIALLLGFHERPAWLPVDRAVLAFTTDDKGTVNPC